MKLTVYTQTATFFIIQEFFQRKKKKYFGYLVNIYYNVEKDQNLEIW